MQTCLAWMCCLAVVASTVSTRVPTLCTRVPPILPAGKEPPRDGRLSLVTARTTREETEGCDSAAAIKVCICSAMDFVLVVVNMTGGQVAALKVGVFCGEGKSHQSEPRAGLGSLGVLVANPMLAWLSLPCWPIFQGPTVILFLPTDLLGPPVGPACHLKTPCCGNFHGRQINLKLCVISVEL